MLPPLPAQQTPPPSLKIPFVVACLLHLSLVACLGWFAAKKSDASYTPLVSIELSASFIEGNSPASEQGSGSFGGPPQSAPQQGKQDEQAEQIRHDEQNRGEKQDKESARQKSETATPAKAKVLVNSPQPPPQPHKPQAKKTSPRSQNKTKALAQSTSQDAQNTPPSPLAAQANDSSVTNTASLTDDTGTADAPANIADTPYIASKPKGNPKTEKAYLASIVQKLHRSLRYPETARAKRISGTTTVQFTVSATGQVSGERIHKASGHDELDKEALALIQRAAPFKSIPPALGHETMTLTVPIRFTLK